MGKLLEELKRRKVFRVAGVYAVVAWVLIQVADTILPALQMPDWTISFVTVLFILGFPIAVILSWAYESTADGFKPDYQVQPGSAPQAGANQSINYLILAIVLLVAGFQVADRFLLDSSNDESAINEGYVSNPAAQPFRSNLVLGESVLNRNTNTRGFLAISPDGRRLAYNPTLGSREGTTAAIHDFVTGSSITLPPSTTGPNPWRPVFSPSGDFLLFSNNMGSTTEIYIASLDSGSPRIIASNWRTPITTTWLSEQSIIFRPDRETSFHTISVNGGPSEALSIPVERDDFTTWPDAVSGYPWIVYTVGNSNLASVYDARIDAFNLETGEVKTLLEQAYNSQYAASGHIVFMRAGDLWAAPLNTASMVLTGDQVLIERGVEHSSSLGFASYTFSDSGRLVYRPGRDGYEISQERGQELSEINGTVVPNKIPSNALQGRFSPDGSRIVFTMIYENSDTDIAVYNIAEQTISRRTFEGQSDRPLWTEDGRQLVYRKRDNITNSFGLWIMNADGSGVAETLMTSPTSLSPTSFSPDGQQLVFTSGIGALSEIQTLSLGEMEYPIQSLFSDGGIRDTGSISPDGRWVVYSSSGRLFVSAFPDVNGGGRWAVSDIESSEAHWGPDGSLYFIGRDDMIYHVTVDTTNGFSTGRPEVVLKSNWRGQAEPNFDIAPDGNHILYTKEQSSGYVQVDTLNVVDNWFEELKRLAPPDQQ